MRTISETVTRTFNRTSMESKRGRQTTRDVLIEKLLIEPVWNRNLLKHNHVVQGAPFNRTSMESKRDDGTAFATLQNLLIEPVWNRNLKFTYSTVGRAVF